MTASDNENRNRARVWLMVMSAGMARGDMEWADALEKGGKVTRTGYADFRKQMTSARTAANQNAMQFLEMSHQFMNASKDGEVPFGFGLPSLVADAPPELERALKGVTLRGAESEKARVLLEQRGVLKTMAKFAGAGDDLKKAGDLMASESLMIPRQKFFLTLAKELTDFTDLYAPKKMDQAGRVKMFCKEAQEALGVVTPSKETKELGARIEAILKKLPKTVS